MGLFNKKLTIGELLTVDNVRQEKAGFCRVQLLNVYHEIVPETLISKVKSFFGGKPSLLAYYIILKLKVISDKGNAHIVLVKLNPDFDLNKWTANKVQIYCDCPDFKYRSAYNLNQKDSLFVNDRIKIALGSSLVDAPKAGSRTTPLCKHAVAALNWIVSNYSSIMKTV